MKKLFFIFTLAFIANMATAQSDFNFSFYPAPKYTKFETVNVPDTTQKQPDGRPTIVAKTDTATQSVSVLVEKQNSRFSVRILSNISKTLYDMNVEFVGVDNNGNMVYKSKGQTNETVFVNPLAGTVEIVFQNCFDEPQPGGGGLVKRRCNEIRHIFGNFAPAQPPTPTKK